LKRALAWPFNYIYARVKPVGYAWMIGDTLKGRVMKGVTIGEKCVAAAKAVVKDGSAIGGNPARVIKTIAEYLEGAHRKPLGIGHLTGDDKMVEYKRIIKIAEA
jgi:hypothetical protein